MGRRESESNKNKRENYLTETMRMKVRKGNIWIERMSNRERRYYLHMRVKDKERSREK